MNSASVRTDGAIMAALIRAADRGLPCPTNAALCEATGARSGAACSEGLSRLEKRGLIRVARFAVAREVTIVASGKSTAPHTGDRTPHWRLRGVVPQPRAEIEASPVVVSLVPEIAPSTLPDRPCFRCESRGWCGHDGRVAA